MTDEIIKTAEGQKLNLSKLKTRLLSGFILAPVLLGIAYFGGIAFYIFCAAMGLAALYEWAKLTLNIPYRYLHLFIGLFYIMFGCCALLFVRFGFPDGAYYIIAQMLCVWASDTGGYAFGKTIGGKKLAPVTSPNKTWAGLFGAMICCGLALFLSFGLFLNTYSFWVFAAGLCFGLIGQIGDLFVSSYKRQSGLKDTGQLIPGHGGVLDRVDAWLLISPAFLSFILLWI